MSEEHDILPELHPPRMHSIPESSLWPWTLAVTGVVFGAGLLLGWRWRRGLRQETMPVSPEQEAMAGLNRLQDFQEDGQIRTAIVQILKRFFARKARLSQAERTSQELIEALGATLVFNPEQLEAARRLLVECDRQSFSQTDGSDGPSVLVTDAKALVSSVAAVPSGQCQDATQGGHGQ